MVVISLFWRELVQVGHPLVHLPSRLLKLKSSSTARITSCITNSPWNVRSAIASAGHASESVPGRYQWSSSPHAWDLMRVHQSNGPCPQVLIPFIAKENWSHTCKVCASEQSPLLLRVLIFHSCLCTWSLFSGSVFTLHLPPHPPEPIWTLQGGWGGTSWKTWSLET